MRALAWRGSSWEELVAGATLHAGDEQRARSKQPVTGAAVDDALQSLR